MSASPVDEILGQIPLDQLAARLGVDTATAAQAAAAVIPSLIGGLQHNADQGNEQAIAGALVQHGSSNLLDSGSVDLNSVDTQDGAKIVQHIFGDQSTQLAHAIGQKTGASGNLVNQLLPILAPIVLAYLAKKLTGSQSGGGSGGMLGSVLGSILSGGALGSILGGGLQSSEPSPAPDQNTSYDPQQGTQPSNGDVSTTTPTTDAGTLQIDDTPTVDETATPGADQQPQSGGSIVDEILSGLFGKR
jgi:hypothetical protein